MLTELNMAIELMEKMHGGANTLLLGGSVYILVMAERRLTESSAHLPTNGKLCHRHR